MANWCKDDKGNHLSDKALYNLVVDKIFGGVESFDGVLKDMRAKANHSTTIEAARLVSVDPEFFGTRGHEYHVEHAVARGFARPRLVLPE